MYQDGSENKLHLDEYSDEYWLEDHVSAVRVNFGTMGVDEDPDAYDRLRDAGYFDDYRYSGVEPWN